ncbi:MFS transporter [Streptomyces sp. ASQP_92]|uniref:MFS transporter n=1 Tax=Streptomyces sp. ASQP_92 TaxID=2979116 RepID=UPI0021C2426F|nr:MFS transporter [Streptomyces sp. ASQP_92]MCT9087743.1 MFS transporter [Streptomyces sp. ASQP_92]
MSARPRAAWPLVAVFTAGYLAAYLLPTVVGRLSAGLGLSPAEAGLVGSTLLLSSAMAGFTLASRVEQQGPRRLARWGLLLAITGYGGAALTTLMPVVVAGAVVGGLGSGTATAVAAAGIAAQRDPHRASTLGLLSVSATAGALYLTIPHLGGGHATPLASIALVAALVWPATRWLPGGSGVGVGAGGLGAGRMADSVAPLEPVTAGEGAGGRLPHRRSGTVLAATMLCWSLAQNALWGVSGRIGLTQAGLSEVTVGMVFAAGLGAGLLGVLGAGALGARLGRAVPIGAGTAIIAGCIVVSASARGLVSFAAGEVLWNVFYPVVLSYLIGLSASLDPRGRWAVLAGSASSLGVACGPLTGSLLSQYAGYRGMGIVLCALLLLIAAPMSAVALHTSGRPLVPGSIRRRGGTPAAVVAGRVGASGAGLLPQIGVREQEVAEIAIRSRARRRRKVLAS